METSSIQPVLNLYKQIGETPLERIERFVKDNPEYGKLPMTYAGRLDPMAEGVTIVLVGDECKTKDKYLKIDKVYEFEFALGVETDTYDILGRVLNTRKAKNKDALREIEKIASESAGKVRQEYPPYSARKFMGRPLHELAREGKLVNEKLPERDIEVYKGELLGVRSVGLDQLINQINFNVGKVKGDFRQDMILREWANFYNKNSGLTLDVYKMRIHSSSGFYVRTFVHNIGKRLGTGAVTTHIKRTRVGDYDIADSLQ